MNMYLKITISYSHVFRIRKKLEFSIIFHVEHKLVQLAILISHRLLLIIEACVPNLCSRSKKCHESQEHVLCFLKRECESLSSICQYIYQLKPDNSLLKFDSTVYFQSHDEKLYLASKNQCYTGYYTDSLNCPHRV